MSNDGSDEAADGKNGKKMPKTTPKSSKISSQRKGNLRELDQLNDLTLSDEDNSNKGSLKKK